MEKQQTELNAKLTTLKFRIEKTSEILGKKDRLAAQRQKTSLENQVEATNTLKETIEEKKFSKGETVENVRQWAVDIEDIIGQADQCVKELTNQLETINRDAKLASALQEHKEAMALEEEKIKLKQAATERAHTESLEFERKRLELQQQTTTYVIDTT